MEPLPPKLTPIPTPSEKECNVITAKAGHILGIIQSRQMGSQGGVVTSDEQEGLACPHAGETRHLQVARLHKDFDVESKSDEAWHERVYVPGTAVGGLIARRSSRIRRPPAVGGRRGCRNQFRLTRCRQQIMLYRAIPRVLQVERDLRQLCKHTR